MPTAAQRIARINLLLRRPGGATMRALSEDLEVSRATVNRDIQYMRDQMNAPIVWDRATRSYRLEDHNTVGPAFMVPGLWLSPAQAYAYLTLHNMVEKIAPNLLGPMLWPMRGLLKELLCRTNFPMYGLDEKIHIDMPPMPDLDDRSFGELIDALLHDAAVVIEMKDHRMHSGIPIRLSISGNYWTVRISNPADGSHRLLNIADILDITQSAPEPA